ncbi:MAG: hypothetical protein JSS80_07710 [Bacteroidetes bacterium]|nr:hypothetical protein [Bacteroidota bacterium]
MIDSFRKDFRVVWNDKRVLQDLIGGIKNLWRRFYNVWQLDNFVGVSDLRFTMLGMLIVPRWRGKYHALQISSKRGGQFHC